MRLVFTFFLICLFAEQVVSAKQQRIVGGSLTTIDQYPSIATILIGTDPDFFSLHCGGNIINSRFILTAAHCLVFFPTQLLRVRVGSTWTNRDGVVHTFDRSIIHPDFRFFVNLDHDIAVLRTSTAIAFNNNVQPVWISGPNYILADNQEVWAAGWGDTSFGGSSSEQLRHVQVYTINHEECTRRYTAIGRIVTGNMLCTGVLDVGGRDQCQGDSGGPVYHHGNLVGVTSWGEYCADPRYPGVNVRVSNYATWIDANTRG